MCANTYWSPLYKIVSEYFVYSPQAALSTKRKWLVVINKISVNSIGDHIGIRWEFIWETKMHKHMILIMYQIVCFVLSNTIITKWTKYDYGHINEGMETKINFFHFALLISNGLRFKSNILSVKGTELAQLKITQEQNHL